MRYRTLAFLTATPAFASILYVTSTLDFTTKPIVFGKGWLAIVKLIPLLLFISLLLMPYEAFDNVKIEKWKMKVVSALQ